MFVVFNKSFLLVELSAKNNAKTNLINAAMLL